MTGALSRQAFDIRLQEEMERARLYQYNLSLVFLAIDHFKKIADTYGHTRGDPPVTITFSAGIAYFPVDGVSAGVLFETADKRVYHAKRGGPGRITEKLGE